MLRCVATLLTLFLFPAYQYAQTTFSTVDDWFQQHPPAPSGWNLQATDLLDSAHVWAVGNGGIILLSRDGGWNWTEQSIQLNGILTDVEFIDTSYGWISGVEFPSRGRIYATTNGGQTWSDQSTTQTWPRLTAINFINRFDGWACGFGGIVLRTTNGGLNWQSINLGSTLQHYDIQFLNQQLGWLSGFKFYKSSNGGDQWSVLSDTGAQSIFFIDSLTGWGAGAGIRKTTDAGLTWVNRYQPEVLIIPTKILFTNRDRGWCALNDMRIDPPPMSHRISMVRTTDRGLTWSEQYMGIQTLLGISFGLGGRGCVVGGETIMYSTDEGENWIRRTNGIRKSLFAIDAVDSLNVWAVGAERTVLVTTNGGARWRSAISPTLNTLTCLSFIDKNHGWVGGIDSLVYFTRDGGVSWMSGSLRRSFVQGLSFVDTLVGWAVGSGDIIHTTDGGASWNPQATPNIQLLNAVDFVDPHIGLSVGLNGVVVVTTNGGENWNLVPSGTSNSLNALDLVDRFNGYAVGTNGTIIKTVNGGITWSLLNVQTTNYLSAVRFINQSAGWIAGDSGMVMMTTNGGQSWARQSTGSINNLFGIDFVNTRVGWATGELGVIIATENGGGTTNVSIHIEDLKLGDCVLSQNYPNPFNNSTVIYFGTTKHEPVSIKVFDILGKEVAILLDRTIVNGGYSIPFYNQSLPSGIYFYQLRSGNTIITKKMLLLR